jgi:hypothetical protein
MSTSTNPLSSSVPALQPPSPTQTMLSPDGTPGEIPVEQVQAAVKSGFKLGLPMTAPDGITGTVSVDKGHDAVKSGFSPLVKQAESASTNQTQSTQIPADDRGVLASLKRTVSAPLAMYHAFSQPATDDEKASLLNEVRQHNSKNPNDQIPEDLAANPSTATLAYRRLISAPADLLYEKGNDEKKAAEDLWKSRDYWHGGNMYLSSLADKGLSVVPMLGPFVAGTANRYEQGDVSGATTDLATAVVGENAEPIVKTLGKVAGKVAKVADVGGLTPEENITKAAGGSAGVHERNFPENVTRSLPYISDENDISKIKTPQDLSDAAHEAKSKVWDTVQQQIANHPGETISGSDVAQKIKDGVSNYVRNHEPATAQSIDSWADSFSTAYPNGQYPLDEAAQAVSEMNAKLKNSYKMDPGARQAFVTSHPEYGMFDDAADVLRDKIDQKLTALGESGSAELRKDYGALAQLERIFEKRAIVYGRQAPINLTQGIGAIASAASGHPVAEALEQQEERVLSNSIDSECHPFRENAHFAGTSDIR